MSAQSGLNRCEAGFAAALLDADSPIPTGLMAWNGSDPAKRFAVYRNNVAGSLIDALADTFPVTQELVGDGFFRAMARVFIAKVPPRSPVLAEYGDGFPAFVEDFQPARGVPYLADVARLEKLYLNAYHAADGLPLDDSAFQAALARADALPSARMRLHPSVGILRSSHAVFSLWAAHQGALDLGTVDPYRAEDVLVVRPHWDVLVLPLRPGASRFIESLSSGLSFGESNLAATAEQPEFRDTDPLDFTSIPL
ncbi:MAG: DNA-binding domain-containing protein [Candidatus Methylumidiphilus sp.]